METIRTKPAPWAMPVPLMRDRLRLWRDLVALAPLWGLGAKDGHTYPVTGSGTSNGMPVEWITKQALTEVQSIAGSGASVPPKWGTGPLGRELQSVHNTVAGSYCIRLANSLMGHMPGTASEFSCLYSWTPIKVTATTSRGWTGCGSPSGLDGSNTGLVSIGTNSTRGAHYDGTTQRNTSSGLALTLGVKYVAVVRWRKPGAVELHIWGNGSYVGKYTSVTIAADAVLKDGTVTHWLVQGNGSNASRGHAAEIDIAAFWTRSLSDPELLTLGHDPFALIRIPESASAAGWGQLLAGRRNRLIRAA